MRHPTPPADHRPGDLTGTTFDVIVLGAGAVGENVVSKPRAAGLSVAIIEPELVGGECSYWACMPSKGLLRPVQVLADATHIGGAIPGLESVRLDAAKVLARRDRFNSGLDDAGQVSWVESTGTTLVRGSAALTGERQVRVTGPDGTAVELTARHAVAVCTGSWPAVPEPLRAVDPWTNREGTSAEAVPESLVVVGGGPVGCELAQAWHRLGATVTLVHNGERLLSGSEDEAGRRLAESFEASGLTVRLGATVVASRLEDGHKVVVLADGTELRAQEVLVGAGRVPSTAGIGLDTVGLVDGRAIDVDDTTTVAGVRDGHGQPWLYACGDCTTRPRLTHMGKYAARVCGEVITRRAAGATVLDPPPYTRVATTADHTAVPAVVFTDPEVASVGLVEAKARALGMPVRCVEYEIGDVAGAAVQADGYDGWAKLVIDTERDVVVGATFVGPGVAELLHAATIAVVGEVPLDRLWHAVPSYPTVSEIWLRLLETAGY